MVEPDGYIYARVNKAWYGLKQAGKIAHDDLVQHLADAGYVKAPLVEGYFRHKTRPIDFTLVVDDFLIKYTNDEDLEHLRTTISKHYVQSRLGGEAIRGDQPTVGLREENSTTVDGRVH